MPLFFCICLCLTAGEEGEGTSNKMGDQVNHSNLVNRENLF